MRRISTAMIGLLVVCLVTSAARSHDYVADQVAMPPLLGALSLIGVDAVGQEFVPEEPSVSVVELLMANHDPTFPAPVSVAVRIRAGSVQDAVLGQSSGVGLPYPTAGWATLHFDLGTPVLLNPGSLYVIEVFVVSGSGNALLWTGSDVYAPGGSTVAGHYCACDFWFREGPASTVSTDPVTWGRIKALYMTDGAGR